MRVLVIGSGAREHALARRLLTDRGISDLLCVPGNPGVAGIARVVAGDPSRREGIAALVDLARQERIDLTIVGPEVPLSLGVVDRFTADGRLIVGPTAAAARLESSKAFAKSFMQRHGVPSARFAICESAEEGLAQIRSGAFGLPVVIKADGLAAGKGVVIATSREEAEAAVLAAMHERRFGDAGARLVIEECMTGPEVSFFALSDGERAVPIGTAQDHKRIFDEDRGPNTGGMGAFAPSPLVDEALDARIMREIVNPVVSGMASEGYPFRGLYQPPDPMRPDNMDDIIHDLKANAKGEHLVVPGGYAGIFERAYCVMGMEEFFVDSLIDPDSVGVLLDKITDYKVAIAKRKIEIGCKVGHHSDDLGCQTGPLVSPSVFFDMILPRTKKLFDVYKNAGLPVIMHSCGNIMQFLPALVDIGLDMLEPVQPCLGLEELMQRFGGKLTFWGGIDTQETLPHGTPGEVAAETRRVMRLLGKGGRYMVAPSQEVMADVPAANIAAMLAAIREERANYRAF